MAAFYPTQKKGKRSSVPLNPIPDSWQRYLDLIKSPYIEKQDTVPPNWVLRLSSMFEQKMRMYVNVDAELLKVSHDRHNVILFSHGVEGHMHSGSIICKFLASQGYIVFSIQHQEEILMDYEKNNQSSLMKIDEDVLRKEKYTYFLEQRSAQVKFLSDQLSDSAFWQQHFGQHINVHKIIMMGYGLGASTMIYAAKKNVRMDGVVALDPITNLVSTKNSTIVLKVPIMFLNSSDYASWIGTADNYQQTNQEFLEKQNNRIKNIAI